MKYTRTFIKQNIRMYTHHYVALNISTVTRGRSKLK